MKKLLMVVLFLLVLIGCGKKEGEIVVGITQIVDHKSLDEIREGIEKYIDESDYEGKIKFLYENAQGDFSNAQLIAKKFEKECDIVVAITTPSAQAVVNVIKDKPVIYSAVTEPISAGLMLDNVVGVSDEAPYEEQVKLIKDICPKAKKIGIVYNTSEANSIYSNEKFGEIASEYGYEVVKKGISEINDMNLALETLLPQVDILFTGKDNMLASVYPLIIEKANKYNKIVIGGADLYFEQGAAAVIGISDYQVGIETGKLLIDCLENKEINKINKVKNIIRKIDNDKVNKIIDLESTNKKYK